MVLVGRNFLGNSWVKSELASFGSASCYMNPDRNTDSACARNGGRIDLPVLFPHGESTVWRRRTD